LKVAEQALVDLYNGINTGKPFIRCVDVVVEDEGWRLLMIIIGKLLVEVKAEEGVGSRL
jgi:hypothetical protein